MIWRISLLEQSAWYWLLRYIKKKTISETIRSFLSLGKSNCFCLYCSTKKGGVTITVDSTWKGEVFDPAIHQLNDVGNELLRIMLT